MLSVTAVEGAENRKKAFTVPLRWRWLYSGLIHQLLVLTVQVRTVVFFRNNNNLLCNIVS